MVALTISSTGISFQTVGPQSNILATVPHEEGDPVNGQGGPATVVRPTRKRDVALPYLEAFAKIGYITGYVTISIPEDGAVLFEFKLPQDSGYIRLHTSGQVDVEAIDVWSRP